MGSFLRNGLALLLDLAVVLFSGLVVFVLVTGGGVVELAGVRVSARSVGNPVLFALLCFSARAWLAPAFGVFGVPAWTPLRFGRSAQGWLERIHKSLLEMKVRHAAIVSLCVIGIAVAVRLLLGAVYFGFMYGDEVEVQQLALCRLIGFDYQAWDLRNTTFPLLFVYPMQWLWHALGARDPGTLVYAGKVSIVLFSGINLWLVFTAVLRESRFAAIALIAVIIFAFEANAMVFGSTALPRTVTSTFVLLGYLLLGRGGGRSALAAGVALGVGAALRFSEVIFFVPAVVELLLRRRWSAVLPLGAGFLLSCGTILALADWIYWGRAFASLEAFARYTLFEGQSTHGFQPVWYYAMRAGSWVNALTLCFAVLGAVLHRSRATVWALLPVVLLSFLPHKEARYVLPVLPFLAILAADGVWAILERIRSDRWVARIGTRVPLLASMAIALAVAWLALDVANYRSPRSEDSVLAARFIGRVAPAGVVLFEWGHRSGGGIYMSACDGWELVEPLHEAPREELERVLRRDDLGCVALRSRTLERFGGEAALQELGWVPLRGEPMRDESRVRVFVRQERDTST